MIVAMLTLALSPASSQAASVPGTWHLKKVPDPVLADVSAAIYLAGDSLTFNAWAYSGTSERIQKQGWILSGFEIHSGMEVWELAPRLEPDLDDLPQTVVIALGMNDLVMGTSAREFRRYVRELIDLLGERRVIWIGLHSPSGLALEGRARAFNRAIKRQMKRSRDYKFANWSRLYSANPDWVSPDDPTGIHLSVEGSVGLTTLMLKRLDSFGINRNS